MKAGNFNINDYLEKLYEESTPMMDGGDGLSNEEGIVIPDTNQKSYQWLKKEYQKAQVEVKVEMKLGGAKFEPGYDLQTDLKSVKDFKPGMFGQVKTTDGTAVAGDKKTGSNLDAKKEKSGFQAGEGEEKEEKNDGTSKSNSKVADIKDKGEEKTGGKPEKGEKFQKGGKPEKKEDSEKEEGEEKEEKEGSSDGDKTKVKKIDLKTKKK